VVAFRIHENVRALRYASTLVNYLQPKYRNYVMCHVTLGPPDYSKTVAEAAVLWLFVANFPLNAFMLIYISHQS
jgi:hypothetical protein